MPISGEMRRLESKWRANNGWPKRLEWLEIDGLRGWRKQRFTFRFPMMAIVGENGVGKSTVLQCAAAIYKQPKRPGVRGRFASDFFPTTVWDRVKNVSIKWHVAEMGTTYEDVVKKGADRWSGNIERRERHVEYVDLSRIQPVSARTGYLKLSKARREVSATPFDERRLGRLSQVMGRSYDAGKSSITEAHKLRAVPVLVHHGQQFSGFHQGAGETTVAELLQVDIPATGLLLIDEIESSLHPRAQRRLVRDLAALCRERDLQIAFTTHSPYVLEEMPFEARAYIHEVPGGREIIPGISPEFAMTRMDDVAHHECDLYVEDDAAQTLLVELIVAHASTLARRCRIVTYGGASVGKALGEMIAHNKFPRPSCVFLDGDAGMARGCQNLPGDDSPERVVFGQLSSKNWLDIHTRIGRDYSEVADACQAAMTLNDEHLWVKHAANRLTVAGLNLWQVMCSEWARKCLSQVEASQIITPITDALENLSLPVALSPNEQLPLFERSPSV